MTEDAMKGTTREDAVSVQTGTAAALPEGFLVGHTQNLKAGTGCTAIIHKEGAIAGVAVRGAAPATRETDLLDPRNTVDRIHAVFLSGGSAFGLDAATGITRWLAEKDVGLRVGAATVPIVCGACLFDLGVGDGSVTPDSEDGYAACENATTAVTTGNVGAGTGASVGKLLGEGFAMKGGLGAASVRLGELLVTALVAVNALGNVFDRATGLTLAGTRDPGTKTTILNPYQAISKTFAMSTAAGAPTADASTAAQGVAPAAAPTPGANTTIGCVLTNGVLTKAQATRVADMAHDGFARAIEPVHTGFDGDTVFALSTATAPTSPDLLGALAALVMEAAIHDAVRSATAAFGLPSAQDLTVNHDQEG